MWWFVAQALAAEDAPSHLEAVEAVRSAISQRTGYPPSDVEVANLGLPSTAPEHASWDVDLNPDGPYCGGVPMRVTAFGDKGAVFRYNLRPHVTIWIEAPLADRNTDPGEPVTLRIGRIPLETLRGENPVDPETPLQARVTLLEGDPVTEERARPLPDAREGSSVTVVAGRGAVLVQAPGRLDEDAYVGKPVRVVNLATRTVLTGTYRADGLVQVGSP
jgi:hypothetical protein